MVIPYPELSKDVLEEPVNDLAPFPIRKTGDENPETITNH